MTVNLYKGEICILNGSGSTIFPAPETSRSPPSFSWALLIPFITRAFAATDDCQDLSSREPTPFDDLLRSLASEQPDDATAGLVTNFRVYECKIYDAILQSSVGPDVTGRLLEVIAIAPVGWSNNRLITNDAFPDLRPNDKAKRVFDLTIEKFILSDSRDLRRQARKLLTTYPARYVREKYAEIDVDDLSALQQLYFSYAGTFIYFRPVISGEHFKKEEMDDNPDIMPKVIGEYKKGIALRPYLDRQDLVDSYILDFGLASSVRNFEKSGKEALVPDNFKPSQRLFRVFLDNTRIAAEPYPFNNQLGWATCFAFSPPAESLTGPRGTPLTLDDAEWFKGEVITVDESDFVLKQASPTVLKACPGGNYRDTGWNVEKGEKVRRLLRKAADDRTNWLFIRTLKGFGWLKEQPKTAARDELSAGQAEN